jgi:FKBP-type peptidyl-prolyl cis-trans isomerase FkpA
MTTTASGLQYEDTTPGNGAEAQAGQRVRVHYTGWLHDPTAANQRGKKFDSSKDRGRPVHLQPRRRPGHPRLGPKACRA